MQMCLESPMFFLLLPRPWSTNKERGLETWTSCPWYVFHLLLFFLLLLNNNQDDEWPPSSPWKQQAPGEFIFSNFCFCSTNIFSLQLDYMREVQRRWQTHHDQTPGGTGWLEMCLYLEPQVSSFNSFFCSTDDFFTIIPHVRWDRGICQERGLWQRASDVCLVRSPQVSTSSLHSHWCQSDGIRLSIKSILSL